MAFISEDSSKSRRGRGATEGRNAETVVGFSPITMPMRRDARRAAPKVTPTRRAVSCS